MVTNYILYDPSELDKCEVRMDRSECLETVLELQRARIAELKAALKPFADMASYIEESGEYYLLYDDVQDARAAYLGEKE